MRCLIVYSSRTGNTKQIAEAIATVLPKDTLLCPVESAPPVDEYDFVCLGFWVDKGGPDEAMAKYMTQVHGKRVALFATLGAWPDSDHARESMENACAQVADNCIEGSFICQGKIDPKLLVAMEKMRATRQQHPMTEERKARIEEAKNHPNEEDCKKAQACFSEIWQRVQGA